MNTLHIHRLRARYHLPEANTGSRARLDGLLARALHEVLAPEVERLALDPHEHVCLRRLEVPVRLRLSQGDAALARTWGESLTRAVQQALEGADPEGPATARVEKVRYPSLLHALVDCAVGVSRHDLRHAWAWRQLELWRETDSATPESALQECVRALQRFPDHVVPVFHALVPSGVLRALTSRLTANQWIALAAAALGAAEVPLRASDLLAVSLPTPASHRDPETASLPGPSSAPSDSSLHGSPVLPQNESTRTALDRLLSRSSLAAVVELQTLAPAARRAVCILMLLDADPGQAAHPRAVWLDRLAAFGTQDTPMRAAAVPPTSEDQVRSGSMAPGKTGSPLPSTPASEDSSTGTGSAPSSTPPSGPEAAEAPERGVHLDPRRRGRTAQGGVLYLLNLLKATDAIADLMREFPGRRLRWTLHQLGCGLAGAEATDPAALAFAGLLPGSVPPTEEEPAATIEERVALQRFMDWIAGEVSTRLDLPPAAPGAVFELVCRRSAEIIADPGWIEAKFSLRDVSLDLRRVGLDLDPGHLPWLGCVVRFTYE